ncbi:SET domain-containing protein, partial [Cadophora sp. DSE1049]
FFEKVLPGRGKGLISNHTFRKGDLILTSTPLFMVQERAMSDMSKADRLLLQQLSISALPTRSRELFYNLAAHFGGDKTEDVLLTNGFSATFSDSREGFGIVVPEAARLNHDCRPNARFAFDPRTLVHKVHATRAIEPGEELTLSYIDEKQIYSARQQHIKAHWGFDCGCKLCSAPEQIRNASDTRLRRIVALRKSLFLFTVENYRKVTPDMALELVSLYEEEGLNGALAEAYMVTSLWHCVSGNIRQTRKWASLAIENVSDV